MAKDQARDLCCGFVMRHHEGKLRRVYVCPFMAARTLGGASACFVRANLSSPGAGRQEIIMPPERRGRNQSRCQFLLISHFVPGRTITRWNAAPADHQPVRRSATGRLPPFMSCTFD